MHADLHSLNYFPQFFRIFPIHLLYLMSSTPSLSFLVWHHLEGFSLASLLLPLLCSCSFNYPPFGKLRISSPAPNFFLFFLSLQITDRHLPSPPTSANPVSSSSSTTFPYPASSLDIQLLPQTKFPGYSDPAFVLSPPLTLHLVQL